MTDDAKGGAPRLAPVSPEEAVSGIRSGDRVFIGVGAAAPEILVEALTARAAELSDVRITQALTFGPARYAGPEYARSFRVTTFFIAPNVRQALRGCRSTGPLFQRVLLFSRQHDGRGRTASAHRHPPCLHEERRRAPVCSAISNSGH